MKKGDLISSIYERIGDKGALPQSTQKLVDRQFDLCRRSSAA
jgi:hypothetical protein